MGWTASLAAQEMVFPRLRSSPQTHTDTQRPLQTTVSGSSTAARRSSVTPVSNPVSSAASAQAQLIQTQNAGAGPSDLGVNGNGPSSTNPPALLRNESVPPGPAITTSPEFGGTLEEELARLREELKGFASARDEAIRTRKSVDAETEHASSVRRQELIDLLTKLATKRATAKAAAPRSNAIPTTSPNVPSDKIVPAPEPPTATEPVVPPPPEPELVEGTDVPDDAADPFALGKVLLKSGDFASAEKAFRKVKTTDENRLMVQYLLATSIRQQSQWKRATEAYRVIAESNQDPILRDLAKWQIENIRWKQQTELQLDQLRRQREQGDKPSNGGSLEEKSSQK